MRHFLLCFSVFFLVLILAGCSTPPQSVRVARMMVTEVSDFERGETFTVVTAAEPLQGTPFALVAVQRYEDGTLFNVFADRNMVPPTGAHVTLVNVVYFQNDSNLRSAALFLKES